MTLDSVDLYTAYGWRLMYVDGHMSQPARKKILTEQEYDSNDFTFDGQRIMVKLMQKFSSKSNMATGVANITTLLTNNATHTVTITEHSLSAFSAVAREGAKVEYWNTAAIMTIKFTKV